MPHFCSPWTPCLQPPLVTLCPWATPVCLPPEITVLRKGQIFVYDPFWFKAALCVAPRRQDPFGNFTVNNETQDLSLSRWLPQTWTLWVFVNGQLCAVDVCWYHTVAQPWGHTFWLHCCFTHAFTAVRWDLISSDRRYLVLIDKIGIRSVPNIWQKCLVSNKGDCQKDATCHLWSHVSDDFPIQHLKRLIGKRMGNKTEKSMHICGKPGFVPMQHPNRSIFSSWGTWSDWKREGRREYCEKGGLLRLVRPWRWSRTGGSSGPKNEQAINEIKV